MKELFQLAKLNESNRRVIELMTPSGMNSSIGRLLSIAFAGKSMSDKQAMVAIYNSKKLSSFSRLKTKCKNILIKAIILQDINSEGQYSRVNEILNHYRHTMASLFLASNRLNSLAILIAERTLTKAIKYGSTENIIILSKMLINYYGSSVLDKNKFKKYLTIQQKYLRIQYWEIRSENFYNELQNYQLYSFATPNSVKRDQVKIFIAELEKVNDIQTFRFIVNCYKIKTAYYEYIKEYNLLLELCELTIHKLNPKDLHSKSFDHNINIRKAWALIQAGRNDEAILLATKDMKNLPSGSLGWYFIAHYKLKAFLYKGDYGNGVKLIKLMVEEPGFSKLGGNHKELFGATLGYIHLIVNAGLAGDPAKMLKILPDFKIGKFLNTIPVFGKDKQGINVSILLMHIGFLLQRKNYDAIIDRIDSLKQYAYKYLRKDDTFRSNCMIKMVAQMTKADFNPIRTERYTSDIYKQLEQVKLAGSGENIETEIIPYEVLWSIMLKA
ncbi:MAG: hypothetical protein WBP41_01145, partial [Saprospiraceae bacterium]